MLLNSKCSEENRPEEALEAIEEEHKHRMEEVREEGKKETALKMKNMMLSDDIISEATGLTVEEIRKL